MIESRSLLLLSALLTTIPLLAENGGSVRVEILEGLSAEQSWESVDAADPPLELTETYFESAFGFASLPRKYSDSGVIVDRSNPFLLRATIRRAFPAGKYRFLLRAFNAARVSLDGEPLLLTPFKKVNGDGHEGVPDLVRPVHPDIRLLRLGHEESLLEIELDGGMHRFRLECFIGGRLKSHSLKPEIGELALAVATADGAFQLLSAPQVDVPFSDVGWKALTAKARVRNARRDAENRRISARKHDAYWRQRHDFARRELARHPTPRPPEVRAKHEVANDIDRFVLSRLESKGLAPLPLIDAWSFLRRVSLDTRGVIPSREEIETFMSDRAPDRRSRFIDRMLDSPRWADHWVPYWQDVLAENPGILKPKLNNTGPFRYWIHESFLDSKPIDRFVTELIQMEGSLYGGGPAGFSMASRNDVPMAAKAHIVGTAFLGLDMKCARCHDAPHHPYRQVELFSLAAMLRREPEEVPRTSTVPLSAEALGELSIQVTLEPGSRVEPHWPFASLVDDALPPELLRDPEDSREQLAALVTSPRNKRFARVIANRLWKRYLGHGLVDPVDDWHQNELSHPELLDYLAHELATHDYDLKHLARKILNSKTYQREASGHADRLPEAAERLFAGPARRRLSAEQLLESLFQGAGMEFESEALNLDVDGRRSVKNFLNLGSPERAWQFAPLSNERDRPAISLPRAQSLVDLLKSFGWRESRQDPRTTRDEVTTVRQPLILANGLVAHRIATLSDKNELTRLALEATSLDRLLDEVYLTLLGRLPAEDERRLFGPLLETGFEKRVIAHVEVKKRQSKRHNVSWSNHLSAEATRIKLAVEREVRAGDPPSARLDEGWRKRMEDTVWTLINSPEFIFVP